ncbi:MAG: hypothetical protein JSS49_23770 [Planctomycetes bacterium]|nr:hypothetical protein [Planctomycetota bacterium]
MKDRQKDYTSGGLAKVTVSVDGYGHLHILIGDDQVPELRELLRKNRVTHYVEENAGPEFSNVVIGGDTTKEELQALLDSVD